MRVVFVVPESYALGVEWLVSVLARQGHQAWILLDPLLFEDQFLRWPRLVDPASHRRRLLRRLLQLRPDLVGFTVVTDLLPWFRSWLRDLRQHSDVPVVAGGVHPNLRPEATMETPGLNWVLLGEADHSLPMLLEHMRHQRPAEQVPGLVWRDGDGLILNPRGEAPPDLDALPFPDKQAWGQLPYNDRYPILTSRGCPFGCSYCYAPAWRAQHPSHRLRRRSPRNVLDELTAAKRRHRLRSVSFLDDVFVADSTWLERFAPAYERELGLPFFAYGHAATMNRERVELLRQAGCQSLTLGFQTHSEHLRREILHRPESNVQVAQAVALAKAAGIFVTLDVILGLPGQDRQEILAIARFAHEQRVDGLSVHWLRVYPGAPIAEHLPAAQREAVTEDGTDQRFFFQGDAEEQRLALLANIGALLPGPAFEALASGGYRHLPSVAGFTVNFPLSFARGLRTGRRRLPVQNGAASTAHKYLHHGLEALTDAAPVRRLRHARMARRSFVESPRLDAVGRARTRQLAKAAWSRQLLGRDRLMSAVFAITYACPLACGHCSVRAVRSRGTLDHRACLDVLDQLAAVGAIKVAFFGGEPTTRRDLPELVAHGARLGLQCSVDSSGMGLDEALARELARARVSNVNISLDHPDPAQHDQLRGRAGAWLAAQAAVAALRTHGIPVLIGTWAGRDRIHDGSIARLIELAKDWDTQGLKLLHPILSGCLAAAEEQRLTVQDLRALHTLAEPGFVYLEDAFALDKPSRHRCSSLAKQMVYIAPDGQLQPCPGLPISFGSLADEPLAPLLERMWGHELYRWRACTPDACLANDPSFRARYLRALEGEPLPLPVEQLPPLWPEDSP